MLNSTYIIKWIFDHNEWTPKEIIEVLPCSHTHYFNTSDVKYMPIGSEPFNYNVFETKWISAKTFY